MASAGCADAVRVHGGGVGEKQYDPGGRDVTPAYWLDMTPTEKSRTYAEEMALIDEINQKYNCNLTFASTGDWHSHMSVVNTSLVNGEKIADVFWAGLWHGGAQAGGQRADCSAGRLF